MQSVSFCPDQPQIVSGSDDCSIRIWNYLTGENPVSITPKEGHSKSVKSVAFNTDGSQIVTGAFDKAIKIWDVIRTQ